MKKVRNGYIMKKVISMLLLAVLLFTAVMSYADGHLPKKESTDKAGNTLAEATPITFNTQYNGTISVTNESDFYKITLPSSGYVTLNGTAYMQWIYINLYNANGVRLSSYNPSWNSVTQQIAISYGYYLTGGTYYLDFDQNLSYTGEYTFLLGFVDSNESFPETDNGVNNTLDTASPINFGPEYLGQIAINDEKDFYKFTLPSSGRIQIDLTFPVEYVYLYLYDINGNQLWRSNPNWNSTLREIRFSQSIDLILGTYYFAVSKDGSRYGNYKYSIGFTSAEESFTESKANNQIQNADIINLNTSYKGQLALNDEKDFYKFSISEDEQVTLLLSTGMEYVYLELYNSEAARIKNWNPYWNTTSHRIDFSQDLSLTAGVYYICVLKNGSRSGVYELKLVGKSSPVPETPTSSPTPTPTPTPIPTVTLAPTPVVPTPVPPTMAPDKISISNAKISGIRSQVFSGYAIEPAAVVKLNGSTLVQDTDYTLSYYNNVNIGKATLIVTGIGNYTGTKEKSFTINPAAPKISSIKAGKKQLTIQWLPDSQASGYQLEYSLDRSFDDATTVSIAKRTTIKRTISGLKKKKTYYVRIRTYKKVNGKKYYSDWSSVKKKKTK